MGVLKSIARNAFDFILLFEHGIFIFPVYSLVQDTVLCDLLRHDLIASAHWSL